MKTLTVLMALLLIGCATSGIKIKDTIETVGPDGLVTERLVTEMNVSAKTVGTAKIEKAIQSALIEADGLQYNINADTQGIESDATALVMLIEKLFEQLIKLAERPLPVPVPAPSPVSIPVVLN